MNWKKSTLQEQWRLWMGVNVTLDGTACWPRSIAWKKKHFGPKIFPTERWSKSARKLQRILRNRDQVQVKHLIWPVHNFSLISWCLFLQGKVNKRKTQWWMFPSRSQDTRHPQGPARLYETARVLPVISSCYIVVALLYCTFVHILKNYTYCAKN